MIKSKVSQGLILKQIIIFLLVLLWMYAASSKLLDFGMFKAQMHRQVLFPFLKTSLVYVLPAIEICLAFSLLFDFTQKAALYLSFALLSAFSIYIALGTSKILGRVPCSCGGILKNMSWTTHLVFNLFFLLLTAFCIHIIRRERRPVLQ